MTVISPLSPPIAGRLPVASTGAASTADFGGMVKEAATAADGKMRDRAATAGPLPGQNAMPGGPVAADDQAPPVPQPPQDPGDPQDAPDPTAQPLVPADAPTEATADTPSLPVSGNADPTVPAAKPALAGTETVPHPALQTTRGEKPLPQIKLGRSAAGDAGDPAPVDTTTTGGAGPTGKPAPAAGQPATAAPGPATQDASQPPSLANTPRTPRPGDDSAVLAPSSLPDANAATRETANSPGDDSVAEHDKRKEKSADRPAADHGQLASTPAQQSIPLAATAPVPTVPQSGAADISHAQGHGSRADVAGATDKSRGAGQADAASPSGHSAHGEDAAKSAQSGQDNLPSQLASQTSAAAPVRAAPAQPYAFVRQAPPQPVVVAQPGQIGRDMGVQIAHHIASGQHEVLVRLDPAEMGKIDVRLSFDDKGNLHAAMSADSKVALDMLRRDAGDLGQALANAGVHTDSSTFRFESRDGHSGQFAQNPQHGGQQGSGQDHRGGNRRNRHDTGLAAMPTPYRRLRASGQVDLTA